MRKQTAKVLVVGAANLKERFYTKAQEKGGLQFTNLSPERSERLAQLLQALKILRSLSTTFASPAKPLQRSGAQLAKLAIETKEKWEALTAREKILHLELSRAKIFGEFSPKDITFIQEHSQVRLRAFCHRPSAEIRSHSELIQVGSDVDWDYFVTLDGKRPALKGLIEVEIGRPHSVVKAELAQLKSEQKLLSDRLHALVASIPTLEAAATAEANSDNKARSRNAAQEALEGHLFAASGYCDRDDIAHFESWFKGLGLYIEEITPDEGERLPTILKNKGYGAVGQDVIEIYDTPARSDQDPSRWVLWAFALFFAIIISDAGYGACLLAITLYLRLRTRAPSKKIFRFFKLMTLLSSFTIAWGVLTASYFGMDFAPSSPVQQTSIMHWMVKKKVAYHMLMRDQVWSEWVRFYPSITKASSPEGVLMAARKVLPSGRVSYEMQSEFSQNLLMELSIVIGILHISLSLLRYAARSPSAIGWVIFLIGGYLYFPSQIDATSALYFLFGFGKTALTQIGLGCLIGGLGVATLLSLFQNKLSGLAEPMTALQLFADVLSYLRLYALALAGMILGGTFNDLGLSMPLWAGIFVIFFGHLVNLGMALIAAVIHGLRLNFLESYHYCFDGGGKPFQPLRRIEDGL